MSNTPQLDRADLDVYEQLGLVTAADRASFRFGAQQQPALAIDIVISTTSDPFHD